MKTLFIVLRPALVSFAVLSFICGIVYTGALTGIAQIFFPRAANGSIITITSADSTERNFGSALIGQQFTLKQYLIGRPMGTTNLSPSSAKEKALVLERVEAWHALDPEHTAEIPADLVTASGSGVDPYISPEGAEYQVSRIAKARGMSEGDVRAIIALYTTERFLGIFGERTVHVLKVNLALDRKL